MSEPGVSGYVSPDQFDCGAPSLLWFAICISGREFVCEQVLRENGVATMLPVVHTIRRKSQHSKSKILEGRPLLRGYLFVGFEQYPGPREWDQVVNFRFFQYVVGIGGTPCVFSQGDIHKVLKMAQRPVPVMRRRKSKKNYTGQMAHIVSGPYQDRMVRISGVEGKRAIEIFEMLQPIAQARAA